MGRYSEQQRNDYWAGLRAEILGGVGEEPALRLYDTKAPIYSDNDWIAQEDKLGSRYREQLICVARYRETKDLWLVLDYKQAHHVGDQIEVNNGSGISRIATVAAVRKPLASHRLARIADNTAILNYTSVTLASLDDDLEINSGRKSSLLCPPKPEVGNEVTVVFGVDREMSGLITGANLSEKITICRELYFFDDVIEVELSSGSAYGEMSQAICGGIVYNKERVPIASGVFSVGSRLYAYPMDKTIAGFDFEMVAF